MRGPHREPWRQYLDAFAGKARGTAGGIHGIKRVVSEDRRWLSGGLFFGERRRGGRPPCHESPQNLRCGLYLRWPAGLKNLSLVTGNW